MIHDIEAKVNNANKANKLLNEYAPKILEVFKDFIQHKIVLKTNQFSKELKEKLPKLPPELSIRVSAYTIALTAKTSSESGNITIYTTKDVYLASIQGGHLVALNEPDVLQTDITVDQVSLVAERVSRHWQEYEAAKRELDRLLD